MAKNQESNQAPTITDGQRIGLFGASGSGKTTKCRQLIKNCNRLVVFDPKHEWIREIETWLKGAIVVNNISDFKRILLRKFGTKKGFQIVYVPPLADAPRHLSEICRYVFDLQRGYKILHYAKTTILIDEAQEGIPAGTGRLNPSHGALICAKMGRDRGVNMLVASQRIKTVDIGIRANLSAQYVFRLSELSDINEANQVIMQKEKLLKMKNFDYFYKDLSGNVKFFEKK